MANRQAEEIVALQAQIASLQAQLVAVSAPAASGLTLTLRRVWPDGGCAYVAKGVVGTIYVKAGFLHGQSAPDTLTVVGLPSAPAKPVAADAPAADAPAAEATSAPAETEAQAETVSA